jgi:two-component system, cell cycle sensor histidine kinase and response regulator CckA
MYDEPLNLFILKSLPAFNFDHKMRLKEHDLNGIVMELEKILPKHINNEIKVKIDLADRELKIMADPLRIKEAFVNLINNANDAMPSGGILTLRSKLASFESKSMGTDNECLSGACALLSISDTGIGMDGEVRKKIYEPFFTTKEGIGRGLGFPIATYIIQSHRGSIDVESTPGNGTTINAYLPLLKRDYLQPSSIPLPSSFEKQGSNKYRNVF